MNYRVEMRTTSTFLLVALCLVSCGEPDPPRDAGRDTSTPTCESPPTLSSGSAEGHPAVLEAPPGMARAGRLSASAIPPDDRDVLLWRAGDYVVANDRIALVIEDVGVSDEFDPWGGQPVGIARVESGALVDPADFNELVVAFGRATLETREVSVLNDGSDGGPAVVRSIGTLAPLGFLEFLGSILRAEQSGIDVAIDYSLAPDSDRVEVSVEIANANPRDFAVVQPLLWAFQQNRMPKYAPGHGFDVELGAPLPFVAFVEDGATSYAFQPAVGEFSVFIEQSNLLALLLERFVADGCAASRHPFGTIHVGSPGLDGVLASVARANGEPRVEVTGTVQQSDGTPAVGARVYATGDVDELVSRATTDATGAYVMRVPAGAINLRAWRRGDATSPQMTVVAPASGQDFTLGASGDITVNVTDGTTAIPAFVQAVPRGSEPPNIEAALGEAPIVRGRSNIGYALDGTATFRLPAATYDILVTRGFEWSHASVEVTVTDGSSETIDVSLAHEVQTPGVLCGDFHIHTERSFDTRDAADLKVRDAVAQGVEIALRSDHEWVGSFEPLIAALGMEEHVFGIGSVELTTFSYGHFGVFPLDADLTARNRGAPEWVGVDAPALLSGVEARTGVEGPARVIVNHPRSGLDILGYFDAVDFDPVTATAGNAAQFYEDIRLVEVFNESDFDANLDGTVTDWFALLGSGERIFAVGSSDTHQVADKPVGYPRTCIDLGVDTAPELRALGASVVRDRLSDGAATIVGGVFVEARARGDVGPGGVVSSAMDRETIDITVRAPTWVPVDRLRVYVDSELRDTVTLDVSTSDPSDPAVRYRGSIDIDIGPASSFVVIVADGEGTMAPLFSRQEPFGVTNPIFFER